MPRKPSVKVKPVIWLSDEIVDKQAVSNSFQYYEKFQFKNIIAEINDFVLVSNADAAEPDTEEGCDAARILSLYEDSSNKHDPFRAKVQWYSKPADLPNSCINKMDPISFLEKEVIEDHRPFDTHVSIETFFKKCAITLTFTKDTDINVTKNPYHYICRYRLMAMGKRKVYIEPVMEEERKAIELLCTPMKAVPTPNRTPKTPSSLVKRMSRVSIQEQKNWSVSKNDGTKLLLKRAILADKTEKDSPKKTPKPTPISTPTETPRSSKKLTNYNIEEALSMELKENSDDELPTLIIRQHVPTTPKRKPSISKNADETPKKILVFEEDEKEKYSTRSGRVIKNPISYIEEELSPVKRTPRAKSAINHMEEDTTPVKRTPRAVSARAKSQIHYMEEDSSPVKQTPRKSVRKLVDQDDDDFKPIPKTPRTPRTPRASKATPAKTPKRSVTRRIMTSELTPSLHPRAHSIETLDDYLKDNKSLPGRENQLDEILSFVRNKLLDGTSGCMYISGVPGTGKTATVCSALKILKDEDDLPDFQLVEVNGMRIAEPRQAYVQIYKQLTGKTVVWEQACSLLEKRFTNPGPRRTPTVLLVDELDALCTRRQDVLYSIMEWAAHSSALLTVLAVANTMDLPERALAARVASRLGLTRLSFAPYTHAQLQAIVASRLSGANVTADAVQLIASGRCAAYCQVWTWSSNKSDFVLAFANTMDLSERALAARVASRLGLTRLSFAPYTHAQLQAIVASRLSGANVTADAVQLIARKVAAVSGDARRALALCGRALELAGSGTAGLAQVQRALEEAASGAAVRAVRNCCPAERLMLRAVAAEVERTGTDETTLSRALSTAAAIVALDGRPYRSAKAIRAPTPAQAHAICARLAAAKLLLLEPKPSEPRLLLNVSPDDVHYATRQITV